MGFVKGKLVDLGSGEGRDTVELLRQGWRVLGIDGEAEAIARLQGRPDIDPDRMYTSMNHHSCERVEALLKPFDIEMLEEEEHPGKTAIGEDKYWLIFHIVARKH
jgi:2-polyprenyl-3-methyl-5-hydroxy-6-metoxy-1,4-benzoquinol methylase